MKKAVYATGAMVAAMALAPAAHAVTTLNCASVSGTATCTFVEGIGTGFYGDSVNSAFDDTFYITLTDTYRLSITLTNTVNVGGPITFTKIELLDSSMTKLGDILGGAVPNDFIVSAGVYALHFVGTSAAKASFSGTIDIAAIPEPASWAMMVLGIGIVGSVLRRRVRSTSVAFS